MDSNSLDSVLSEQGAPEQAAEQPPEVVEQQADEPTGEQASAPPAPPADDPIETHRKGLETAVVAERRKRQEAEARAQALEQRLQEYAKPAPAVEEGAPDPAQYQDNPQEYWAKLARFEARQELKLEREKQRAEAERAAQQKRQGEFVEAAAKAVDAGRAEFTDFDAVVNNGLAPFMNQALQAALVSSPNGHKLAYHLGKNPAEAARLAQMPPHLMFMELGELRGKVQGQQKPSIPQTLTQARDTRGQFKPTFDGPTPLSSILGRG